MAKKILLIEDDTRLAQMLTLQLTRAGYAVVASHDGVDGLQKAKTEKPDLLIVDLMLPKKSGWQLCHSLRNSPDHKQLPILVLSAWVRDESPPEGSEVGDAYVGKPFQAEELLGKIKTLLDRPPTPA